MRVEREGGGGAHLEREKLQREGRRRRMEIEGRNGKFGQFIPFIGNYLIKKILFFY